MILFEDIEETQKRLQQQVSVKEDHIVINVSYEYDIALSRCDTAEKLLGWVLLLTEKAWMTKDVMRRFIEVACHENKIKIDNM